MKRCCAHQRNYKVDRHGRQTIIRQAISNLPECVTMSLEATSIRLACVAVLAGSADFDTN